MDIDTEEAGKLKEALGKHRERHRFGKYPERLRARARKLSHALSQTGKSKTHIAGVLGVSARAVDGWLADVELAARSDGQRPAELSLVPVFVEPVQASDGETFIEVTFSDGTSVAASGFGGAALRDALLALKGGRL
jgi:hypothetical protein